MNIRLMRSPEGSESAGVAVIEAPETAAPAPETQGAEPVEVKAEKPKATDWEMYQKIQEKYARDPNAKPTKAELAISKKYLGKEESQIAGYQKPTKGTPEPEDESTEPAKAAAEEPEADPLEPVYKAVGAKDKAQLKEKVDGLVNEVKTLSGLKGEMGRVLKDAGVRDLQSLQREIKGGRALHQLVQDLKAGKAEAFAYIGVKGELPRQEAFDGEIPDGVLDDGLFRHISPMLKAAKDEADALRQELRAIKGKLEPWERSQQETAAVSARNAQKNAIITEASAIVDMTEGLWDSKKSGPLSKALNEYYDSPADAPAHPDLKPILEILDLAKTKNLPDLETALALWERKNGGSLIAKARADAREPFVGKAPNVGLSDRQGNHNGSFKSYTEAHVKEMIAGKRTIPKEWVDVQGTFDANKVPSHLRHLVIAED